MDLLDKKIHAVTDLHVKARKTAVVCTRFCYLMFLTKFMCWLMTFKSKLCLLKKKFYKPYFDNLKLISFLNLDTALLLFKGQGRAPPSVQFSSFSCNFRGQLTKIGLFYAFTNIYQLISSGLGNSFSSKFKKIPPDLLGFTGFFRNLVNSWVGAPFYEESWIHIAINDKSLN